MSGRTPARPMPWSSPSHENVGPQHRLARPVDVIRFGAQLMAIAVDGDSVSIRGA